MESEFYDGIEIYGSVSGIGIGIEGVGMLKSPYCWCLSCMFVMIPSFPKEEAASGQ